jgi:hypothetical protein
MCGKVKALSLGAIRVMVRADAGRQPEGNVMNRVKSDFDTAARLARQGQRKFACFDHLWKSKPDSPIALDQM